jgi:cell division protein ZipA
MTELQIILIVCAVVFVGSLYWWGKKSKNQPIHRAYLKETLPAETPEDEGYEVTPIKRDKPPALQTSSALAQATREGMVTRNPIVNTIDTSSITPQQTPLFAEADTELTPVASSSVTSSDFEEVALSARMSESAAYETPVTTQASVTSSQSAVTEAPQNQLFALLVLSASAKFTRKQLHVAMEASRLVFHQDGTYVKQDANGNIVFRIANVVEPGYFPSMDDADFESPGVALVLELPNAITPYRAMDEFITVARKVSQNLGAKLYDAQRHLIKESDLKAMREYAQSLTF